MSFGVYRPWGRPPQTTINIYQNRPMPHHHHCGGGGGSFWGAFGGGFIGGLLGSFSRMPMIGGFFGGMPTMPMMGGMMMPTMMPTMPTMPTMGGMAQLPGSTGNTPATQTGEKDQFAGVRKLFPDYTFEEINGKYYVRNEDGVTEYESFDKMMDALVNTSENPNAEELAQIKAQAAQKGAIAEVQQELDKFKENNNTLPEGVTVSVVDDLSDENNRKYKIESEGKDPIYCDTIKDLEVALAGLKPAAAGPAEATSTATQQTTGSSESSAKPATTQAGDATNTESSTAQANKTEDGEEPQLESQSTDNNKASEWSFIESKALLSQDAWFIRRGNNGEQKLRLEVGDGHHLNYDKFTISNNFEISRNENEEIITNNDINPNAFQTKNNGKILIAEKYRDKDYMKNIKLVDDEDNYIPARMNADGSISVIVGDGDNDAIPLEEFLQHPDQYQLKDAPSQ